MNCNDNNTGLEVFSTRISSTSSNSQPNDCVSQTLTHARVIYPFKGDKPRLLNVIVPSSVARIPWEVRLRLTWIAFDERVCIVARDLVAIIHSRLSRAREEIDYIAPRAFCSRRLVIATQTSA